MQTQEKLAVHIPLDSTGSRIARLSCVLMPGYVHSELWTAQEALRHPEFDGQQ